MDKVIDLMDGVNVVLLNGELGAGKTTFSRFLIRSLIRNQKLKVLSPTFSVVNLYSSDQINIAHFDCYRITTPQELYEIGIEEFLATHICIVEWPETVLNNFLKDISFVDITIESTDEKDERMLAVCKS